ncbi:Cytochrome c oxidase copper chaperone [Myotis davidii]|uniref:Cytochrome c oxidase copper chaperone n=1 Tax=Myotis davidii TaxID=225400 RepID=L5MFE7_MYODS|nr:Cytochrome c oxidase copper chaperone [Myotis davidii]
MPGLAAASPAPSETQEKKPLKPCCACPETKKARDAWSVRGPGRCPLHRLGRVPALALRSGAVWSYLGPVGFAVDCAVD